MHLRPAVAADVPQLLPLLLAAMGEVFALYCGRNDEDEIRARLAQCLPLPGHLYACEHILVSEENGQVLGAVLAYDGGNFEALRRESLRHFRCTLKLEPETEAGEYYIDSVAVAAVARGRGLGTILLRAALEQAQSLGFSRASLLVSEDKIDVQRLYRRLGFYPAGQRQLGVHRYQRWFHDLQAL